MGQIKVEKNVGGIQGLCVIEPTVHGDSRGYFMETYNENDMKEAGLDMVFVQDNQSCSTKGVLRGLHFQKQFYIPQGFAHGFLVLSDIAEFCYKCNDPEIGIQWPQVKGSYHGSASAEGYVIEDGTALNLSDKDQKWLGIKATFRF